MGTQTQKVIVHNHINVGSKPKRKGKGRRRGTSAKKPSTTYDGATNLVTPTSDSRLMMQMLQANRGFSQPMMLNDINGALYQQRMLGAQAGGSTVTGIPEQSVKMLGDKIDKANENNQAVFSQGYRQLRALTEKQHDLEQKLHDVNATKSDVGNLHDFDDVSGDDAATLVAAASPFKFQGSVSSVASSHASPSRSAILDREADEAHEAHEAREAHEAPEAHEKDEEAKPKEEKPKPRHEPTPRKNKKTGEWGFGGRKPTKPKAIARRAEILLAVVKKA